MPKCPVKGCDGWINPVDLVKRPDLEIIYECNECEYVKEESYTKEIINENIYGIPFEKLYGANPGKVYEKEIEKFFNGESIDYHHAFFTRPDGIQVAKGFIWVSNHTHFETLTVEPKDGSQREIAVRMKHDEGDDFKHYKYAGYAICELPFQLQGFDTRGH